MKRMNEVFELPVSSNDGNHMYETGSRWHVSQFYGAEKAQHAAHAINHIDSLADALESLTSDYVSYRAVNGIDLTDDHSAALDVKMNLAIAALAAYWGEK